MNKVIILLSLFGLIGCVSKPLKLTAVEQRRAKFKSCVSDFLAQEVGPLNSLTICKTVFKKPKDEIKAEKMPASDF